MTAYCDSYNGQFAFDWTEKLRWLHAMSYSLLQKRKRSPVDDIAN